LKNFRWTFSLVMLAVVVCWPDDSYSEAQTGSNGPCSTPIEARIASAISASHYDRLLDATNDLLRESADHFGKESRCYASALSEHAVALQLLNRGVEARPIFEEAIALFHEHSDDQDPKYTLALNNYGVNLFWLRRYPESAQIHEEALELRRKLQPPDPSAVADSLHNLADAYRYLGRPPLDVEKLYQEALGIKQSLVPRDDVSVAETRQNLASAQENLGKLEEAFDNLEKAHQVYQGKLNPDDIRLAAILNRQGILYFKLGNYQKASEKLGEALRLERRSATTQQATLAATLDDFALNQIQLGKYDEAKALANESLKIRRLIFPSDHPTIARTLSNLSYVAWLKRNLDEALGLAREASRITITNAGDDQASKFRLQRHLLMLWSKMASTGQPVSSALIEEAFYIGQQASRSSTSLTVARTTLRFSANEPGLRDKLKAIDDLDRSSAALEQTLTHSLTVSSDPSVPGFSEIRTKLSQLATKRKELIAGIRKSFPNYSQLIDPAPLSVRTIQNLLEPNEALISFVAGFEDIYVWCVTRTSITWRKIDLSPQQLKDAVKVLRTSLDVEPTDPAQAKDELFDLGLANKLYAKLIGPIEKDLYSKGKLLVVASGPLIGLPLQVLVSKSSKVARPGRNQPQAFRTADWLIKRFAISELPSVESLEGLRKRAAPGDDRKPLIGFANPLPSPEFVLSDEADSGSSGTSRGVRTSRSLPAAVAGTHDTAALRQFLAGHLLKSTGPELKEVGTILGADDNDLYIGNRATETQLKTAKLASYRVVYFATHGYVAGTFSEGEPSLALTVPDRPTEFDDGLLTASEVAQLTLDADWVVLSACDTASGDGSGAEGLSGLARAFFHAGARALLVSNWSVDDITARQIMAATFQALHQDNSLQKGQALRRAMMAQIAGGNSPDQVWDAYPGRWAAFEVVGAD
jgi:CHAT domain-containing protein/Tfp pilus assembly protein PilF